MADPGTVAVKAALTAASMALNMLNKTEGPRLSSLDVSLADYGTAINYFWGKRRLEGLPIIWAEKLREKKKTSKGKGGKYAEYQYFGTWACLIAGHQIDAITRIWLDKHLVYDVTKASPISPLIGLFQGLSGSPVKISRGKNMRVYYGDQTEPDRRIEEWCEDRYGADTCPAYKGMAYIVFEELPLEKFGNRIPQITVEAVNNASDNLLFVHVDDPDATGLMFSPDGGRLIAGRQVYDTATRELITSLSFDAIAVGTDGALYELGDHLGVGGGPFLTVYGADGHGGFPYAGGGEFIANRVHVLPRSTGSDYIVLSHSVSTYLTLWSGSVFFYTVDLGYVPGGVAIDSSNQIWAVGDGGSGSFKISEYDGFSAFNTTVTSPATGNVLHAGFNSEGYLCVVHGSYIVKVDTSTGTVVDSANIGFGGTRLQFSPGGQFLYSMSGVQGVEVDLIELTSRTMALGDWVIEAADSTGYDAINHAFVSIATLTDNLTWRFIDRVASNGTDLGDIVEDVAEWCGLTSVDVADLDQVVEGYSVTQGPGKDMLAPLLDIHDVDARPHDFTAQFIKRDNAAIATIDVADFVREGDVRYTSTIRQDTDLPRRITLNFADQDKDQQTNTVISQRPLDGTDATREQTIDLTTYVSTPGNAQKYADRYFRRQWNQRETINLKVTAQRLAVEPGDALNLALDEVSRFGRVKNVALAGGAIALEVVRDALTINTLGSGTGAEMGGRDEEEVYIPAPTKGIILDIPLVRDSHNSTNPILYYGAGAYSDSPWPGAIIYERDYNDDEYFEWNGVDSSDKAVWGYATEALPGANPNIWDRASSVNINAKGTLTSTTEAAIDGNPLINLAYLGEDGGQGELLNFTTATLESDGTYTLSGLKRGRRGTEGYVGEHAANDTFCLVSSLEHDGRGLDDILSDLGFKAQSLGRDPSYAPLIEFNYTGASLKPYAPAHFTAVKNPSTGDWDFTWVRRTRVGGNWGGGFTIPLGETSENYKVRIYDPADPATLVRTITATSETATWTAAQQTTDFGGSQTELLATVCQVADAVDGFVSTIERGAPSVRSVAAMQDTAPSLPTYEENDLLILACQVDSGATVTTPAGYDLVLSQNSTSTKLYLFLKRATITESSPSVAFTGTSLMSRIISIQNAITFGNPIAASASSTSGTVSQSIPGLTTPVDNCLILDFVATGVDENDDNFSGWTNADLVSITEKYDQSVDTGGGGGLACAAGVRGSAGSVGSTTMTADQSDDTAVAKLAIRPR